MDFHLPELGEGVYEAELVRWLVKPGDAVKRGQTLMEVMTDKATMEVPAPFAGTITELRAEPGQTDQGRRRGPDLHPGRSGAGRHRPAGAGRRRPAGRPRLAGGARSGGTATATLRTAPAMATPCPSRRRRRCGCWPASSASTWRPSTAAGPAAASSSRTCTCRPPGTATGERHVPVPVAGRSSITARPGTRIKLAGVRRRDRRAHGPGQAHHPALHLRRRVRRHRAGPAAGQPARSRSPAHGREADLPAVLRQGGGRGAQGSADRQRLARRGRPARSSCTTATTSASPWPRRPA